MKLIILNAIIFISQHALAEKSELCNFIFQDCIEKNHEELSPAAPISLRLKVHCKYHTRNFGEGLCRAKEEIKVAWYERKAVSWYERGLDYCIDRYIARYGMDQVWEMGFRKIEIRCAEYVLNPRKKDQSGPEIYRLHYIRPGEFTKE